MNLLLLLTALLTSLTGMMSGGRADAPRAPAAAVAAERIDEIEQAATVLAAIVVRDDRPHATLPTLGDTNLPLSRAFALAPVSRLTPEKRRE